MEKFKEFVVESNRDAAEQLNGLCWHDSILYEVQLIRRNSADQVLLSLQLIAEGQEHSSSQAQILFNGCYLVRSEMNWGVKCMSDGEMIYSASSSDGGDLVEAVRKHWKGHIDGIPLSQFKLELASTGSTIEIVFRSITIRLSENTINHPAPIAYPIKT